MDPDGGSGWDEPPLDIQIPDDARELDRDVLAYRRELRAQRRRRLLRRLAGPLAGHGTIMPLLASILAVCLVAGAMLSVATFSPAPGDRSTPRVTTTASHPAPRASQPTKPKPSASPSPTATRGRRASISPSPSSTARTHSSAPSPRASGSAAAQARQTPADPALTRDGTADTIFFRPREGNIKEAVKVTHWTRRLLFGAVAVLVPALAGCEAGLNAPTLQYHPAANGATANQSGITVNNAFVLGPAPGSALGPGDRAGVFLTLTAQNGDQLVSASAPGTAASVTLSGGSVNLSPQALVDLEGPQPSIVLTGLQTSLTGGQMIQLVLNFANAGSISIQVPVEPQAYEYATYSPPATPTPTPTPTPTATSTPKPHHSPSASTSPTK